MRSILPLFGLLLGWVNLQAQCPVADFTSPASACMNEEINLVNSSSGATSYMWDFCETELGEPVSVSHITSMSDAYRSTFCFDFVRTPSPTVLALRNSGILNYMHLSEDLTTGGSPVSVTGLTGAFSLPRAFEILKEDDKYFALVNNSASGQSMTLVDFGSAISSSASFTRLNGIGVAATNGLEVIRNENNYDVFTGLNNGNTIYHLNFQGSITSTPTVTSFTVPGATSINHIEVSKTCDGIIGIVSSQNNKLFLLNFFGDIFSAPVVSEISYTGDVIVDPAKFDLAFDQGEYYLFLHTDAGVIHRLTFGNSLLNTPQSEKIWDESINGYDIKLVQEENKWKGLFVDYSVANRRLSLLQFDRSCGVSPPISTEVSPTLNLSNPGEYKVTLNAVNSFGYTHSVTKSILITDKTPAAVAFESEGSCLGYPTSFSSSTDKAIVSYEWLFGDGSDDVSPNPVHQYSNANIYQVNLSITDIDGCRVKASQSLKIYPQPQADFTLPANLLCTNNEFTFPTTTPDTYDGNLAYQWFVDDNPVDTERELRYTFTTPGTKNIKLVTAIPGCSDEVTKTTSSVEPGPVVNFNVTGVCEDEVFTFQNDISEPVDHYSWGFGNGHVSNDANPSQVFTEFGNFSVSLTATSSIGCENTKTKTISVHSRPLVDFFADGPPNTCTGTATFFTNDTVNPDQREVTNWVWKFGDSPDPQPEQTADVEHVFAEAGDYNVSLTATTAGGCIGSLERVITIHPSPSTAYTSTPTCEDLPVLFTPPPDNDIDALYWEIGTYYYDDAAPTHTFTTPGDYPLYLEASGVNGCIATLTQTLHVPAPLSPDFSFIKNCVGHEAVFTDITSGADPVITRQWDFGNEEIFSDSPMTYTFTQPESRSVTLMVTAESGCVYKVSKTVMVADPPVAEFTASPSAGAFPLEVIFSNSSANATQFHWEFADGSGNTSEDPSPVYAFQEPGSFNVELTAYNAQQCEDSFSGIITTVAPLPDVDIDMINLTTNPDGTVKLIVTIHNKGNTVLKDLPLYINFDGDLELQQRLGEPIAPATKFNFVFSTSIVNPERLGYLCVSLDLENDLFPAGNRVCKQFQNELVTFPVYPNPSSKTLNIEWISESTKNLHISLADRMGRTIFSKDVNAVAGLNRQILTLDGLENGIYFLVMDDGTSRNTQRVVVLSAP